MVTIQVCLPDHDTDYWLSMLRELRADYEKQMDLQFGNMPYTRGRGRGGRIHLIRRPDITNSYIFKEALKTLYEEYQQRVRSEELARQQAQTGRERTFTIDRNVTFPADRNAKRRTWRSNGNKDI